MDAMTCLSRYIITELELRGIRASDGDHDSGHIDIDARSTIFRLNTGIKVYRLDRREIIWVLTDELDYDDPHLFEQLDEIFNALKVR